MTSETDSRSPQDPLRSSRPEARWRRVLNDARAEASSLADLLTVAARQVQALTTAIGDCGISVVVAHNPGWVHGYSAATAGSLNIMQFAVEEGPCPEAFATGHPVYIGDLDAELRWPLFTTPAKLYDTTSVLVQPMALPAGEVIGTIALYSPWHDGYASDEQREVAYFAAALARMSSKDPEIGGNGDGNGAGRPRSERSSRIRGARPTR